MIKMTINGKPATSSNIKTEFDKMILEGVIEITKNAATSILTLEEQSQITIDVEGNSLDNLSLKVSGPDELVDKVSAALS
ncbi:hypothetical protein [Shewanella sp. Isolate8]|uniref:hypothetical protein n=1 Tax=Shewanella sp. Isolate8 TaxID=2908529 RepID=UPI001EFC439D|nr:hypothetical protein [Shewanella sp. Isolate8]MCG9745807.1 hypothetical protein [Shewanella sp. Isolate8]